MPPANVIVYDQAMRKIAYLENAFDIGYETPYNNLWTASFSLPATDEKNAECQPLNYVEVFDGNERIDLFRILPATARRSRDGQTITYRCEHVLGTLLDDVLFQYHTIGNLGVYTQDVVDYVLQRQTTARWQRGTINFARQFEYNWENENLLGALFSIPKPFDQEYMWTWDTTTYPWTINLVAPPAGVQAYIRYGVNMQGISKDVDPYDLCTRIYPLGYGEGVNQLNITELNGGLPYLDADTQDQYGIVSKVWVDRRFTSSETLLARAQTMLEQLKTPRISYQVEASELYALTDDPIDRFVTGAQVRVIDDEMGVDVIARVVNKRKDNVLGAPGAVTLEIANRAVNIAGSIAELNDRQRINEVYAQGATNYDSHSFADNADPNFPAVMRFWIPDETARINKVKLSYRSEAFRAYSRAIEGGGGIATSTASGGGTTVSSAAGGGIATSTASGGGAVATSGSSSTTTTLGGGGFSGEEVSVNYFTAVTTNDAMHSSGEHNHGIPPGTQLATAGGGTVTWTPSGNHVHPFRHHNHGVDRPPHSHGMQHTHQVDVPAHTHDIALPNHQHNVSIPAHTHDITLPDHTHGIDYGIFQGPTPTAVTVRVDGNIVPGLGTSATDVDIVPFLSKDGGGKIQRGWHEVTVTPNSLGRIVATVFTQIFAQSRGGGDY